MLSFPKTEVKMLMQSPGNEVSMEGMQSCPHHHLQEDAAQEDDLQASEAVVLAQAYEAQVSLVRVAQNPVEACEAEVASRGAEIDALQVGMSQMCPTTGSWLLGLVNVSIHD